MSPTRFPGMAQRQELLSAVLTHSHTFDAQPKHMLCGTRSYTGLLWLLSLLGCGVATFYQGKDFLYANWSSRRSFYPLLKLKNNEQGTGIWLLVLRLPNIRAAFGLVPSRVYNNVTAHTCIPATGEAEARGSDAQGHPESHSELGVNAGFVTGQNKQLLLCSRSH